MTCKRKTEVYSRVVGYYRPVQQMNPGKKAEFHDRTNFTVSSSPDQRTGIKPMDDHSEQKRRHCAACGHDITSNTYKKDMCDECGGPMCWHCSTNCDDGATRCKLCYDSYLARDEEEPNNAEGLEP